jgi:hypothetical protein
MGHLRAPSHSQGLPKISRLTRSQCMGRVNHIRRARQPVRCHCISRYPPWSQGRKHYTHIHAEVPMDNSCYIGGTQERRSFYPSGSIHVHSSTSHPSHPHLQGRSFMAEILCLYLIFQVVGDYFSCSQYLHPVL